MYYFEKKGDFFPFQQATLKAKSSNDKPLKFMKTSFVLVIFFRLWIINKWLDSKGNCFLLKLITLHNLANWKEMYQTILLNIRRNNFSHKWKQRHIFHVRKDVPCLSSCSRSVKRIAYFFLFSFRAGVLFWPKSSICFWHPVVSSSFLGI